MESAALGRAAVLFLVVSVLTGCVAAQERVEVVHSTKHEVRTTVIERTVFEPPRVRVSASLLASAVEVEPRSEARREPLTVMTARAAPRAPEDPSYCERWIAAISLLFCVLGFVFSGAGTRLGRWVTASFLP